MLNMASSLQSLIYNPIGEYHKAKLGGNSIRPVYSKHVFNAFVLCLDRTDTLQLYSVCNGRVIMAHKCDLKLLFVVF